MAGSSHPENEAFVRAAVARGDVADFSKRPGHPYNKDDKPHLPAAFVRRLLLGLELDEHRQPLRPLLPGVRICGARLVDGELDLADCAGAGGSGLPALALDECDLPHGLDVSSSRLARLSLQKSRIGQVWAEGLRIDGDVDFRGASPAPDSLAGDAQGYVWLRGARIGGDVIGMGAHLVGKARPAINLQSAQVGGSVSFFELTDARFQAEGIVSLRGARIGGNVSFDGAVLRPAEGSVAVNADGIQVGGAIDLRSLISPFEASGSIWLQGARIGGNLDCSGAILNAGSEMALMAEGAQVEGAVLFMATPKQRFEARGCLNLLGARIKGNISCDGARFHNPDGEALVIEGAEIGGAVLLRADDNRPFEAEGSVFLLGARIAGNLGCSGGRFSNPGREAIMASRAVVGGTVLLSSQDGKRFQCNGSAIFIGARIGGDINCLAAQFSNPGKPTLNVLSGEVKGDIQLFGAPSADDVKQFESEGVVILDNARVGGDLMIQFAAIKNEGWALSMRNMHIEGQVQASHNVIVGAITLAGTRIRRLFDDPENAWGTKPRKEQVELNEVTLDLIGASDTASRPLWRARRKWLQRNTGEWKGIKAAFSNQPWRQVAAAFERAGLHADARRIRRAELCEANKHRGDVGGIVERFKQGQRARRGRAGGLIASLIAFAATPLIFVYAKLKQFMVWFFGELLFGYGLSVSRATITALLVWGLGAAGVVVMSERGALVAAQAPDKPALRCVEVQPALYALDVMVPVLDLGQERECVPGQAPGEQLFPGYDHPYGDDRFLEEVAVWRWLKALYALFGAAIVGFALLTYTGVFTPRTHP